MSSSTLKDVSRDVSDHPEAIQQLYKLLVENDFSIKSLNGFEIGDGFEEYYIESDDCGFEECLKYKKC
jgi:hypothetical protein